MRARQSAEPGSAISDSLLGVLLFSLGSRSISPGSGAPTRPFRAPEAFYILRERCKRL